MASYDVRRDPRTGIVQCRVYAFVSDEEADALAAEIKAAVAEARTAGKLRMLFDNAAGKVFSAYAKDALDRALKPTSRADDRTAVLVADNLNKLQAKRSMGDATSVFVSETAAMTWLTAWD